VNYSPKFEPLEPKRLPSGLSPNVAFAEAAARRATLRAEPQAARPTTGFLAYRITNPNRYNNVLKPPFQQVLVQQQQPAPGQTYNILSMVMRNGTSQTFTASDGFEVRFPQQPVATPILEGDRTWEPGEWIVFYVLTKKYYPLPSQATSGFEFNLDGTRSVAIPGPSAIFQRIRYDPVKFPRMLDAITAFGVGAQGGRGVKFGLPVTNIYEFLSAKTDRNDFGGYF
jgi:hypothetical protein